jgi:methyl-accepting chemotaxis protein
MHAAANPDQAVATMDEVVNSVKRVTDIMGEIMAASQEQASGIEQIKKRHAHCIAISLNALGE